MKNQENIDKLFRKALANLNTEPPVSVKSALDKHLDSLPLKKPWINSGVMVGVISLTLLTTGYFFYRNNNTETIPVASSSISEKQISTEKNTPAEIKPNQIVETKSGNSENKKTDASVMVNDGNKNNSAKGNNPSAVNVNEAINSTQNQIATAKNKSAKVDDENKNSLSPAENNKPKESSNKSPVIESKKQVATSSFEYKSEQLCHAVRISFTNTSTFTDDASYLWDLGDGSSAKTKDAIHEYDKNGDYTVRLFAETRDGKSDYQTTIIHVELSPSVNALFTQEPDLHNASNTTINFTDKSSNVVSWLWDFGDGKYSAEQNPSHQYDQEGTYEVSLVAKNINNCVSVYKSEVNVYPFWIPNAFTPNDDGKNDVFFVSNGNFEFQNFSMTIYNRKGLVIYSSSSYSKPWNGTDMNGQPALEGSYIYIIQVTMKNGKSHTIKGNLSLIR